MVKPTIQKMLSTVRKNKALRSQIQRRMRKRKGTSPGGWTRVDRQRNAETA